ncbi:hypothetical protein M8994_08450 [Brucella sp. 21LCYQ03]|nr:hypothetical protein [Brucella sp. 21LCYQ03]
MIEENQSSTRRSCQSGGINETLNLRPLPKPLGHNGPYFGGTATAIERDCSNIPGHSHLFREFERFEPDLREAITIIWDEVTALKLAHDRLKQGLEESEDVIDTARSILSMAFGFMQEAYLIAEVLNDREKRRIADHKHKSFIDFISSKKKDEVKGLARLAEDAEIEWMISALLDRRAYTCGIERSWPKPDTLRLMELSQKLSDALMPPSASALQDMEDSDLAATLQQCERTIAETRERVSLIHALRIVRRAQ